jgi:calcineurin-like phosphoesterase family protein
MSEIWFTSDTHFGHVKIIEYQPNRLTEFGLDSTDQIPEMNEAMVEAWNAQVAPGDTVYHLGDFAMGNIEIGLSYVRRLNGSIRLIMGNHDRPHPCRGTKKLDDWAETYIEAGFESITLTDHFDFDGVPAVLNHFPYHGDHMDEERYTDWRPIDHGQVLVHGHVHGLWKIRHRQVNVGMDAHGGRLLHHDEVVAWVKTADANR